MGEEKYAIQSRSLYVHLAAHSENIPRGKFAPQVARTPDAFRGWMHRLTKCLTSESCPRRGPKSGSPSTGKAPRSWRGATPSCGRSLTRLRNPAMGATWLTPRHSLLLLTCRHTRCATVTDWHCRQRSDSESSTAWIRTTSRQQYQAFDSKQSFGPSRFCRWFLLESVLQSPSVTIALNSSANSDSSTAQMQSTQAALSHRIKAEP